MSEVATVEAEAPKSNLRSIQGGRAIRARDVLATFTQECEELSIGSEMMAGYFVIVWDDEGTGQSKLHLGVANPYSCAIIPDYIRRFVDAEVVKAK